MSLAFEFVGHELTQELIQGVVEVCQGRHDRFLHFFYLLVFEYFPRCFLELLLVDHLLNLYYLLNCFFVRFLALQRAYLGILPEGKPWFRAVSVYLVVVVVEVLVRIARGNIFHEL